MAEELVLDLNLKTSKAEAQMKRLDREFNEEKTKLEELRNEREDISKAIDEQIQKEKEMLDIVEKLRAANEEMHKFSPKFWKEHPEDYMRFRSAAQSQVGGYLQDDEGITRGLERAETELSKIQGRTLELRNTNEQVTNEYGKQSQKLTKTYEQLLGVKGQIQDTPTAFSKAGTALDKFSKRVIGLAKRVFIFSVITMALRKLRKAISDMIGQDSELQQYVKQIKGNFAVMGRTLFESMRPVIEWLLQKIAYLTQLLAVILAKVLKKDVKQMADMAKSSAKTAKNAERTTAAFDTLQKIDTTKNDNDSDAGASFEQFDVAGWTDEQLAKIMAVAGTAMIAVGLILCFFGHIGLGIAAIAAGVAMLYTAAKMSNELEGETKRFITKLMAIVGTALIVIGVILCLTQNYLVGIAAIAIGVGMIVGAVVLNWSTIKEKMTQFFEQHKELIGHFFIVLGVILCMTGIGAILGVALIKKGAEELVEADPEKYGWLEEKIIPALDSIWKSIKGTFLVVIGIILAITGIGIPLGISLIKKGMAEFYEASGGTDTAGFMAWLDEQLNSIREKVYAFFEKLPDGMKVLINGVIRGLNWLIEKANNLIAGLNGISFGDWSPNLPYINYLPYLNVPKLANGAVIAGGSPFLAMLGDQRKGQTNIETPLETMIEAFKAAQSETNVNIEFTGSLSQLARLLNPQIRKEQKRASIW